ncbi:YciI family protein [Mucilaginibacter endophyticus]|uniref:YciI family protein n=1 Tax=Mucilaginibacter endophyticus TaxID=2675003 RepID=UPI000E0D8A31|nr:YciI family protein [Mucilaginibacter endophyticus]
MKQYLVTAYDYTDAEAFDRRMAARPHHVDGAKALKANGNLITAGAMLNEDGKMVGSTMIVQFESLEELEAWKQNDPYITQRVWESVDVKPFKVADL